MHFEVLVVDDFSTDGTGDYVRKLEAENENLHILTPSKNVPGKKLAIYEAVQRAQGEWILMTDADCAAASNQWIKKMMSRVTPKTDLELGYGSYKTKNTLLNRLIRYETFYIALQYFSAAILGYAYMGVGRNLAFRKAAFLEKNPFNSDTQIAFGDDDTIVQAITNRENVAVCLDADSYTLSESNISFVDYFNQKRRHIRPSQHYKSFDKIVLVLLGGTHIGMYMLVILLLTTKFWLWVMALIIFRWVLIMILSEKTLLSNKEKNLIPYVSVLDPLLALSYFFQALFLPVKKRNW